MPATTTTTQLRFVVGGMHCASCSGRAQRLLLEQPGVTQAEVNLATEVATLQLQPTHQLGPIADALAAAGFEVQRQRQRLRVEGMHCASCVGRVQRELLAQPGVIEAEVNLATDSAEVQWLGEPEGAAKLAQALTQAGFAAGVSGDTPTPPNTRSDDIRALKRRLIVACLLALPVFVLAMGEHIAPAFQQWVLQDLGTHNSHRIQFIFSSLAMLGPGLQFYTRGFPLLWRRTPDMNSLVAMGTSAAWLLSTVATFFPGFLRNDAHAVYFEASAVIIALVLLGRYFEARAKGRTGEAIQQLLKLQANTATVLLDNGDTIERDIATIEVGDEFLVKPGERIATDAQLLSGSAWVDESMVSGEPLPVEKHSGDALIGGTVNGDSSLTCRATRVGNDTLLAQIIALVEQAQGARLPIQNLVDQVVRWFVPAVITVATLSAAAWALWGPEPTLQNSLLAAVTVLIIACPCAMGLATPTSIMVGSGRAARLGVLFRRGDALQSLHTVDTLVFDKTGTLTEGKPQLVELQCVTHEQSQLLRWVASAESQSEHPIASALVTAAQERALTLTSATQVRALPGMGLSAQVENHQLLIGAERLMTQHNIDTNTLQARTKAWAARGHTSLYVAVDGQLAAALAVADTLKPSAAAAVSALRAQGLRLAMVSGDNLATCEAIAAQLSIDTVIAEVLPEGKVEALEQLRKPGTTLAFVGDGINDAPALASADVGIALGSGTDVAIESADVVLISDDLGAVANAFEISRRTLQNIRQNLFWAFAYNVLLIPVAAGLLYPINGTLMSPLLASLAMALSSVFVVSNALRLRHVRAVLDQHHNSGPNA